MTETLPRLLALQACDQRIRQADHMLETLQQSLSTLQEEAQAEERDLHACQDKIKEAEQVRAALTLQLDETKVQLRDRKHALHRHRARQGDEAVQREVTFLEAHKAAVKEKLCTVEGQLTQNMAALGQAEEMIPTQHEERQRATAALLGQVAATEEELRVARDERTVLVTGISPFLLHEYERIFSHRSGVAVVAIEHETCQGCHMHVPVHICLELQRNPRLAFCPHCHRIVFVWGEATVPRPQSPIPTSNGHHTPHPPRRTGISTRSSKTLLATKVPQTTLVRV